MSGRASHLLGARPDPHPRRQPPTRRIAVAGRDVAGDVSLAAAAQPIGDVVAGGAEASWAERRASGGTSGLLTMSSLAWRGEKK